MSVSTQMATNFLEFDLLSPLLSTNLYQSTNAGVLNIHVSEHSTGTLCPCYILFWPPLHFHALSLFQNAGFYLEINFI